MAIEIHWICDDQSLAEHCRDWQQLPFVAVDTEFMRVDTFYPKAGLIQIGDGQRAFLIDPLLIGNWQPLASCWKTVVWSRCCMPAAKTSKCCCA